MIKQNKDLILNNKKVFETYYKDHYYECMENAKHDLNLQKEFLLEYPLSRFETMPLEEYALGKSNTRETFSYKIEFGKYAGILGIGGNTSKKHGAYWRKEDGRLVVSGKNIEPDRYDEVWKKFREQLFSFLTEYGEADKPLERNKSNKYPLLNGMALVLTKLLFLYYPNKFLTIAKKVALADICDFFGYEYDGFNTSEDLNYLLSKQLKEDFSFIDKSNLLITGWLLWDFLQDVIYDEEDSDVEDDEDNHNYGYDVDNYSRDVFLQEAYIDPKKYDLIVSTLKLKKNIILEGAPGVGKTFMAKRIAYSLIGCTNTSKIEFVQFHQSYSYEDFVEGIRPDEDGKFTLQKGIFYEFCKKAENNPNEDYFFIIDEINRGNLSKIFGELLMLMESDKRGEEVKLVYSHEPFSIPTNLYIIGCMNTADRSLALIDYALRRRFAFINIEPAFENESFIKEINRSFKEKAQTIIDTMKEINEAIKNDNSLGKGFVIGHSYFCNKEIEDLPTIVNYEIIPLFEEYWYDEETTLKEYINKINEVLND